jgi:hypothetical protein
MLWLESDFFSFFWLHIIRIVEVELIFFQFLELTFSSRVFFVAKFLPLASKKGGGGWNSVGEQLGAPCFTLKHEENSIPNLFPAFYLAKFSELVKFFLK